MPEKTTTKIYFWRWLNYIKKLRFGRHDIQLNDIRPNDIQPDEIQPNDIQANDIQHNDIQHNDIQHNNIQNNDIQPNKKTRYSAYRDKMLSVVILSVEVPYGLYYKKFK